jgi:hypothetical protein
MNWTMKNRRCEVRTGGEIDGMSLQRAPAIPTATAIPATATKQKHDKNNDEDRFHV